MHLPVDVVIPHKPSRDWLFRRWCLPSIEAQNPARIIIMDGPGGAPEKRNEGVSKSESAYVVVCDDDIIWGADAFTMMLDRLDQAPPDAMYTYGDWIQVPLPGCKDGTIPTAQYVTIPKYCDMNLSQRGGMDQVMVERKFFVPFDTNLKRYQTWEWGLAMRKAGWKGVKTEEILYMSFMVDKGITTGTSQEDSTKSIEYIRKKYGFTS